MLKKIAEKIPEELKVIWQNIPDKRLFYAAAALAFVSSGITAFVPYIYGRLTDAAVSRPFQYGIIFFFLILWFALSLFNSFITRGVEKISNTLAVNASSDFFLRLVSHLFDLPLAFHKDKKFGIIWRKATAGESGIFNFLESTAFYVLPRFLSLFIALFIVLFLDWRLAVILVFIVILYVFITFKRVRFIISEEKKSKSAWDKAYGAAADALSNIFSVKSFTAENFENKKNRSNFSRVKKNNYKVASHYANLSFVQNLIFDIGFIAVFGAAFLLLGTGEITIGKFIMFIGYFNLITGPIAWIGNQYRFIKRVFLDISRALKLSEIKPEADYPFAKDIGKIKGKVVFQDVSFGYKKGGEVLKNVSFSAEPGEFVALVGESGVGKSTLVNLISRYYLPNKGKIFIDGKEMRRIKFDSLRKQIAFVPQEVALFNDTVKNNIAYGKIGATGEEIAAAAKAAGADEFIEKFPKKYEQIVGERGVKLSTGQKQRIAIARAILRDPRILILDEATAALDSVSEKLVQEALQKLIKGRTVFVIAHRLSTIINADKIIVLEKGEIAETGRHEDLIKQEGVYKKFWELQTRIEAAKPARLLNGMVEGNES
ncbi:ABC transporter ATP-binding protein [Candidatus Wolfebacteria bacterium]|nr:ABC transporter ATP-binding protein [Candidatus Wolfebacteria bacterium]